MIFPESAIGPRPTKEIFREQIVQFHVKPMFTYDVLCYRSCKVHTLIEFPLECLQDISIDFYFIPAQQDRCARKTVKLSNETTENYRVFLLQFHFKNKYDGIRYINRHDHLGQLIVCKVTCPCICALSRHPKSQNFDGGNQGSDNANDGNEAPPTDKPLPQPTNEANNTSTTCDTIVLSKQCQVHKSTSWMPFPMIINDSLPSALQNTSSSSTAIEVSMDLSILNPQAQVLATFSLYPSNTHIVPTSGIWVPTTQKVSSDLVNRANIACVHTGTHNHPPDHIRVLAIKLQNTDTPQNTLSQPLCLVKSTFPKRDKLLGTYECLGTLTVHCNSSCATVSPAIISPSVSVASTGQSSMSGDSLCQDLRLKKMDSQRNDTESSNERTLTTSPSFERAPLTLYDPDLEIQENSICPRQSQDFAESNTTDVRKSWVVPHETGAIIRSDSLEAFMTSNDLATAVLDRGFPTATSALLNFVHCLQTCVKSKCYPVAISEKLPRILLPLGRSKDGASWKHQAHIAAIYDSAAGVSLGYYDYFNDLAEKHSESVHKFSPIDPEFHNEILVGNIDKHC